MAQTTGLLQKVTVLPTVAMACVWIGPTPTNTALLFIRRDANDPAEEGEFQNSMIDALVAAQVSRREVVVFHGDTDSRITALRIDPA